jgi:hypothetical protein
VTELPQHRFPGILQFSQQLKITVDFQPKSMITIRKAWDNAFAVAHEISDAVCGLYFDDCSGEVIFDARVSRQIAVSMDELAERCRQAFAKPEEILRIIECAKAQNGPNSDYDREWRSS